MLDKSSFFRLGWVVGVFCLIFVCVCVYVWGREALTLAAIYHDCARIRETPAACCFCNLPLISL